MTSDAYPTVALPGPAELIAGLADGTLVVGTLASHEVAGVVKELMRQIAEREDRNKDLAVENRGLTVDVAILRAGVKSLTWHVTRLDAERDALLRYLIEPWHHDDGRTTWHVRSTVGAAFDSQDEAKDFVRKAMGLDKTED